MRRKTRANSSVENLPASSSISATQRQQEHHDDEEMVEDTTCASCCEQVVSKDEALKCELCYYWFHCKCQKVSSALYATLVKEDNECQFSWYCRICRRGKKTLLEAMTTISGRQDIFENELNILKSRQDSSDQSIESAHTAIAALQESQSGVASEAVNEMEERSKREDQIVVFRLPESKSPNPDVRKAYDATEFGKLCEDPLELESQPTVTGTWRIGKKKDDGTPRPLKVKFQTKNSKKLVLDAWRNVPSQVKKALNRSIAPDCTPLQREENQKLWDKSKEMQKQLDRQGITEVRFVVRGNRIIKVATTE